MNKKNFVALTMVMLGAVACGGGGGGGGANVPSTPVKPATPAPTVTLTISQPKISLGASSTLTWTSTDATSCTAAGSWSGVQATSGSAVQTPSISGAATFTLSCTGVGGTTSQSVQLTVSVPVQKSSYANAKQLGLDRLELPKEVDTSQAYSRADFKGNGKIMLFTTKIMYKLETSTATTAAPSLFTFWSQAADGSWVKESSLIDTPTGCVHPRKTVVADFNLDGIPDVLVACHGYDGGEFAGEKMWIVLSTKSGVFHSAPLQEFVGFFHSVSAADLNGDGSIDFVAVDPNSPLSVRMFINKGDGTFTEAFAKLPSAVQKRRYYSIELVDVNADGKMDMLVGGHDWEASPTIFVEGDGTDSFAKSTIKELPSVANQGVVLDFLVANGAIYVDRTSGGGSAGFYQSKVIQKVDIANFKSSVLYSKDLQAPEPGEWYSWFPWLLETSRGIESDNVHLATSPVR